MHLGHTLILLQKSPISRAFHPFRLFPTNPLTLPDTPSASDSPLSALPRGAPGPRRGRRGRGGGGPSEGRRGRPACPSRLRRRRHPHSGRRFVRGAGGRRGTDQGGKALSLNAGTVIASLSSPPYPSPHLPCPQLPSLPTLSALPPGKAPRGAGGREGGGGGGGGWAAGPEKKSGNGRSARAAASPPRRHVTPPPLPPGSILALRWPSPATKWR